MITSVEKTSILLIYLFSFFGLAHGAYNIISVILVKPKPINKKNAKSQNEEINLEVSDDKTKLFALDVEKEKDITLSEENVQKLENISKKISDGANVFLLTEYMYLLIFVAGFALLIFLVGEQKQWTAYTTIAFIVGAGTSIACGFIGMKIATESNYRTTYSAHFGLGNAFLVAYQGGCVMGFILVSLSLFVLISLILIYKAIYLNANSTLEDHRQLFEAIAGYGLGGSLVALFCRVGGGIYTKAADVGADLVAKLEMGLEEDDPRNPAAIADNVGDNVGDIAGMGSDLFGSMAESLTAGLLIGATSPELIKTGAHIFPLVIIAFGIMVSILTSIVAYIFAHKVETYRGLEWMIKFQLIISTVLLIPTIAFLCIEFLPDSYNIGEINTVAYKTNVSNKMTMICPLSGLVSGLLIGLSTEYYTSMSFAPVKGLVNGCKSGAAINIILGIALGFVSNILPTLLIALTVLGSYMIAGMFGIALAALGMLSNLPICLAIDGYGPISDNAGGLASMCELNEEIRQTTDYLDSAGNTTAAIGKGFAIGSACLVALSLFGAFITRTRLQEINALTPIILSGLIIGAMLPFLFSALTMKAVGTAAQAMVEAVREDFKNTLKTNAEPDSNKCIQISTSNSLSQMFLPGGILIFTPIFCGVFFGPKCVAGMLIGIIISGIQMAISAANSGGAWDNAKKSIKNKGLPMTVIEYKGHEKKETSLKIENLREALSNNPGREDENTINIELEVLQNKKSELEREIEEIEKDPNHIDHTNEIIVKDKSKIYRSAEKASIIGDTVGDPLKDTSGPSLNILIKLSSIISVVFGSLFLSTSYFVK